MAITSKVDHPECPLSVEATPLLRDTLKACPHVDAPFVTTAVSELNCSVKPEVWSAHIRYETFGAPTSIEHGDCVIVSVEVWRV